MLKTFLIIINLQIFLLASTQILLVIADNINSSKAKLHCIENNIFIYRNIDVNLGKNGLGIGIGYKKISYTNNEVIKQEGDKRAPLGIFKLTSTFGYKEKVQTRMPYTQSRKNSICVDDSASEKYNQIITMPDSKPKSFEYMRRKDHQYEIGIVVQHNLKQKPQAGSCIFIHVQKKENTPTAGCTSMKLEDLEKIIKWLDSNKNPILIQVSRKYLDEIKKLYPKLKLN